MANGVKITDRDKGFKALCTNAKKINQDKPYVKVGVLGKAGTHKGTALTVASIAAVHEYGSSDGRIPERSFIRSTIAESQREIDKIVKQAQVEMIRNPAKLMTLLGRIGLAIQGLVQKKITDGDAHWPKLKPGTIAAKGSSKPLIDTGQLRSSISFEVKPKGGK